MPWVPDSIYLYNLCRGMNWAHLPAPGGLYDQDPKLLSEWLIIFNKDAEKQAAEMAKNKPKKPAVNVRNAPTQ